MCGLYGYTSKNNFISNNEAEIFNKLSSSAEIRGKEACGFATICNSNINVEKFTNKSSSVYKQREIKKKLSKFFSLSEEKLLMGHSRLQTHGSSGNNANNQPVRDGQVVLIHNGIICNHNELAIQNKVNINSELDSEYLVKRFNQLLHSESSKNAMSILFKEIEGEATIVMYENENLHLATNCGNLYYIYFEESSEIIFASEEVFLKKLNFSDVKIVKLEPKEHIVYNLKSNSLEKFELSLSNVIVNFSFKPIAEIESKSETFWKKDDLQICSLGILNENMPGLSFNKDGISNFAEHFQPFRYKNIKLLENILSENRVTNKKDIVVGFSGGRDSSYMLHLLKNKYNMNPIAVTYDWGMVTDLARRNQARICGSLGIEHVIVAADIKEKRKNINRYLTAWLKKPHLGMVPLLMAGDKKYFQVMNETAAKNNVNLICIGSAPYEFTSFKTGFAGSIDSFKFEKSLENILQASSFTSMSKLVSFYASQLLKNPSYINPSLLDAILGFKYSYFDEKNYVQFFEYEQWDEDLINHTLINEYGWETDPTTPSTWRIGDGTAPFYNFIYRALCGFSEYDTFRNNQVLNFKLSREKAIEIVKAENEPRFEKIEEYLDLIDMDYNSTIDQILSVSKYV